MVVMDNFKVRQYRKTSKQASKTPTSDDVDTTVDKCDPAYLKRREQVRRAQRTHRERKENYIKALEGEVDQLRSQTRTLNAEVSLLRGVIRQLDVGPVRESTQKPRLKITNPQPVGNSSFFPNEGDACLSQDFSSIDLLDGSALDGSCSFPSELESCPPLDPYPQYCKFPDDTPIPESALTLSIGSADQASLGLEFVLTLESPCKQHHVEIAVALSGNHQILNDPSTPVQLPVHTNQDASNSGLENLLAFSENLSLTSEITPVQAWYEIRSHPDFQYLDVPRLQKLAEDLLIYVRCYGFGAVIETDVFRRLYNELWPRES